MALLVTLAGCAGLAAPPPPEPAPTPVPTPTPVPVAQRTPEAIRCRGGHLTVGDLVAIDAEWAAGIQGAIERAKAWRADARLVSLRVTCQPLEPMFRWQGTFYSETAQSFFASDTAQTEPAEVDPTSVPTLPLDRIAFVQLRLALARAGYDDAAPLDAAAGVEVRLNAPTDPFGPPGTPADLVYYVAVEDQGEIRDLFVSGQNWTIYSYRDRA